MGVSAPHTNQQVFHCYKESAIELCGFGQLCYYASATALVMSLVPQMHKNSYLKSTAGLSSLWATSLFIATLVNCFFMFAIAKLIYFKIATVICGVMSFGLLCQFWMYSKQNVYFKVTLLGSCMVVSIALITVELAVPQPGAADKLEWLAITLFSIDLLPQVKKCVTIRLGKSTTNKGPYNYDIHRNCQFQKYSPPLIKKMIGRIDC